MAQAMKIAIVDDEQDMRQSISQWLALSGFDTETFPSAVDGGLTVFREGEVASEMAPYVFGMGPGEISPPVQTRHGLNLIQIVERFDPDEIRLEDMHDRLYAELLEKKTQQELGPWLKELRENRYVEVIAPDLR